MQDILIVDDLRNRSWYAHYTT